MKPSDKERKIPFDHLKDLNLISGLLKAILFMDIATGHKKVKKCKPETVKQGKKENP